MSTPHPDIADRVVRKLDQAIMHLRVVDARISMRLSACPPDGADEIRQAQLNLRASIAELRMIGAVL